MKPLLHVSMVTLFLVAAGAQAQQPEPGAWWGSSPGVSVDDGFRIEARAEGLVLIATPSGKTPVEWGPITVAADGTIEFHRAGDPRQPCALKRTQYDTYEGSCRGSVTRPLALAKRGNPGGFEIAAGDADLKILARAQQILSGPSVWNRLDDRVCDDRQAQSWSLYCALTRASLEVTGGFAPGRPVMQEARAAVVEVAHRSFQRGLLDFNNLESTTYSDVAKVFTVTERRLRTMRVCLQGPQANMFAGSPAEQKRDDGRALYWIERIGHTVDGQTFVLANLLGPMDHRAVDSSNLDDWVAESASVKRRTLPDDPRHLIDATGMLANGHQWRYASVCGESLSYYDVSPEAAGYFDRLIDSAYLRGVNAVH
jgi:hypothetical protein